MSWWIVLLFDATKEYQYHGWNTVREESRFQAQLQAIESASALTSHWIVAGVTFGPFESQPGAFR